MRRSRRRDREDADAETLQQRVARLEADLTFLRAKHEALLAEGDRPRRENAVLRYDLQKCQRDRQVLDWHLNATRGELRMALALVRRYDGEALPEERALLERAALLTHQARGVGVGDAAVAPLAAAVRRGWSDVSPDREAPQADDAVAVGAARLVAELEARSAYEDPTDGEAPDGWRAELRTAARALWAATGEDAPAPDD